MKYLKHYWVDLNTEKYCVKSNSIEKRHPEKEFPGLDVKIWMHDSDGIDICLSQVSEDISIDEVIDEETGKVAVCSITEEEFNSVYIPLNDSFKISQENIFEMDEKIKLEKIQAAEEKRKEAISAFLLL